MLREPDLQLKESSETGRSLSKQYVPKAPARPTLAQAIAINAPGGRCAAIPSGGRGSGADAIRRARSSIPAIWQVRGRGSACGVVLTRRGVAGAEETEHECGGASVVGGL